MDFFDFIFGKKEDKNPKEQVSSKNEKVNENKPFPPVEPSRQANDVSTRPANSGISPIEQYVKESVADLKKHTELSTKDLEAEAIYLAAFLYMKGSYQIDFELDYFSSVLDTTTWIWKDTHYYLYDERHNRVCGVRKWNEDSTVVLQGSHYYYDEDNFQIGSDQFDTWNGVYGGVLKT